MTYIYIAIAVARIYAIAIANDKIYYIRISKNVSRELASQAVL